MDHLCHESQLRGLEGSFGGKVGSSGDSVAEELPWWEGLKGCDVPVEEGGCVGLDCEDAIRLPFDETDLE